jgi:AraC-like DNA-binding protein
MEEVTFLRLPSVPGLELKKVCQSRRLWTRFNLTYAFSAVTQADSTWVYRRQANTAAAGTVVLMEPGETHRTVEARQPASFGTLFVSSELMDRLCRDLGWTQAPHLGSRYTRERNVFAALLNLERLLEVPRTRLELDSRLLACVRAILREGAESIPGEPSIPRQPASIRRACSILQERFAEDISLEELAISVGLSRFYLLRLFRLHTGMPPHSFLLQVRLARARELLKRTIPAGDVARQVGFFDQSHLGRHFLRTFGISPGRYAVAQ